MASRTTINRVICLGGRGRWVYADPIIGTRRSTKRPSGADGRETVALPPAAREAPCPSHRNCYHRNCSMRRSLGAARLLAAHLPQMPFRRRIARCCCACSDRGSSALAIRIGWMGCPPIRRRERTRLPCRDGLDRPTPLWEMKSLLTATNAAASDGGDDDGLSFHQGRGRFKRYTNSWRSAFQIIAALMMRRGARCGSGDTTARWKLHFS